MAAFGKAVKHKAPDRLRGARPFGGRLTRQTARRALLLEYYAAMLDALGPSGWWPGDHPVEIAVGAVLVQNTAWRNVEKALDALRQKDALDLRALCRLPLEELEEALRPSGYFRVKARRLRGLCAFLLSLSGNGSAPASAPAPSRDLTRLDFLGSAGTAELRKALLNVRGVGPETADAILLYALERPTFVADAYTRRIFSRHGLVPNAMPYEELRLFFMDALPVDVPLYNEYHALIVRTGHHFCKKQKPLCGKCPLGRFMERAGVPE